MNVKKMVVNAILIAIGVILHTVVPSFGPAQPDFALAMLFIIMLLNRDYKTTLLSGIIMGIFTALTTKTAGGQLPNIIDKLVTCNIMYLVLLPLRDRLNKNVQAVIILALGTLISGTTFLTSLMLIAGMDKSAILPAIATVVIPTALINIVVGLVIYNISEKAIKITKIEMK